jgi:hypothetical protein
MDSKQLLDLKLDGYSSLRDVFNSHLLEGQFGIDGLDMDEAEIENFFNILAQKIIDAVRE